MIYSLAIPWTSIPLMRCFEEWGLEVMTERTRVMFASMRDSESRARRLPEKLEVISDSQGGRDEGGSRLGNVL